MKKTIELKGRKAQIKKVLDFCSDLGVSTRELGEVYEIPKNDRKSIVFKHDPNRKIKVLDLDK